MKTLGVLFAALMLMSVGCAKKNKPDVDSLAGSANAIQDKDMDFNAVGSDSGKIDGLYTIHFDYDKSNLTSETRDLLAKDAAWMRSHENKSVQIEGHCDRHGSEEYNMALGQRRADAVKKYMVNLGIAKDRLSTISYGNEKLLDTADNEQADAKNRRANFKPIDSPKIKRMSSN